MNKRIVISLPVFMLAGGLLSVMFGKELCWDLANYHFYNPFAFLNDRDQYDFWPGSFIHQYINPTIDFLSYFLIIHASPWSAEFILGAIHACNAWLLFLIAKEFTDKGWIALFLALFGMYGPTVLPGLGSFMNDNFISLFVLGFVLFQIKSLRAKTEKQMKHYQLAGGILLGMGLGLKLTAGIFLAGAIVSTLILPVSFAQRMRMLFYWGSAAVFGCLLTAGYWMVLQWIKYHNPVFPFFNGIFHSTEFMQSNWRDMRFLPHGLLQHLFYPFYFSFNGKMTGDNYEDCRILFVFVLFLMAGAEWMRHRSMSIRNDAQYWLFSFVIFSYWIWQEFFSIARYFAAGEMLAPLIIYLLMQQICTNKTLRVVFLTLIYYTIAFMMTPIDMVRARWYDHSFFNVSIPASVKTSKAHVLISYPAYVSDLDPRPQSYLIPFFPRHWHFTGIPFWHGKYLDEARATQMIKNRLIHLHEPVYLLSSDFNMPEFYRIAAKFNLQSNGHCQVITSDRQAVTRQKTLLCPVKPL